MSQIGTGWGYSDTSALSPAVIKTTPAVATPAVQFSHPQVNVPAVPAQNVRPVASAQVNTTTNTNATNTQKSVVDLAALAARYGIDVSDEALYAAKTEKANDNNIDQRMQEYFQTALWLRRA